MASKLFNVSISKIQGQWEFLPFTITTCVFMYYLNKALKNLMDKRLKEIKKSKGMDILKINKAVTIGRGSCYEHFQKNFRCYNVNCDLEKLSQLLDYIDGCDECLDICIYSLTSKQIADCIINAFQRGIRVRIITDADTGDLYGSQIPAFRKLGIPIRQEKSNYIMHHKFVIIDKKILMSGSMNFTVSAVLCNWENIIVTTQPAILIEFIKMFEELWLDFSPRNLNSRIQVRSLAGKKES